MSEQLDMDDLDDLFDEIEDFTYSKPEDGRAEALEAHGREMDVGAFGRAEYLRCAVEWWRRRGRLDEALSCAEDAISDGGPTYVDPRADLLGVLLDLKDEERIQAVSRDLRRNFRDVPNLEVTLEFVADDFASAGRLKETHRWFTLGLSDIDPDDIDDEDTELSGLLRGRDRVRRELGLPKDRYDIVAERVHEAFVDRRRITSGDIGSDFRADVESGSKATLTLLHWPDDEFEKLVGRWPDLAEGYGGTAEGHREETERHLRTYAEEGIVISVGHGSYDEYLAYAKRTGADPAKPSSRPAYAAELGRLGHAKPYPPRHQDPCWCGSGEPYASCCATVS